MSEQLQVEPIRARVGKKREVGAEESEEEEEQPMKERIKQLKLQKDLYQSNEDSDS